MKPLNRSKRCSASRHIKSRARYACFMIYLLSCLFLLGSTSFAAVTSCTDLPVRIAGTPPIYFSTLQDAYNSASYGATIEALTVTFRENLVLNRSITVTITGGYDCGYVSRTGSSSLQGTLTNSAGKAEIGNFMVVSASPDNTYVIAASASTGGSISPAGTVSIAQGGSRSYTMTPDTGYKIAQVTVDAVPAGTVTTHAFNNITSSHSIEADFEPVSAPIGSITVNTGAAYTNVPDVTLTLSATDAGSGMAQMRFSNDNVSWSTPVAYAAAAAWTLSPGDGKKTVYVRYKDNAGVWSIAFKDSITLDTANTSMQLNLISDGISNASLDTSTGASTNIYFRLVTTREATVTLKIRDMGGNVKYQETQTCPSTNGYFFTWSGLNSAGGLVPDGAYTYTLEATNGVANAVYDGTTPAAVNISCTSGSDFDPYANKPLTINFNLSNPASLNLDVLTPSLHRIPLLVNEPFSTGGTYDWYGRDELGNIMSSGTPTCAATPLPENTIVTTGYKPRISDVKIDPTQVSLSYGHFADISYTLSTAIPADVIVDITSPDNISRNLYSGSQTSEVYHITWPQQSADRGDPFDVTMEGLYTITIQLGGTNELIQRILKVEY